MRQFKVIQLLMLMFLTYINELSSVLERYGIEIKMFAYDVKVYLRIIN